MRSAELLIAEARRAAPYALVLAALLGTVVIVGAHQSNAFPSADRPFGWPGPSGFAGAVAMVRGDLVLAASIPALLLGARALARRDPARDGALLLRWGVHAGLLMTAVAIAGAIGAAGARKTPLDAYAAFVVAHSVLALSFYSLGFLWSSLLRRHATAAAAATWIVFVAVFDRLAQTVLFRSEGYHNLSAGLFPDWFWVSQALSPISSYRGILILWRPDFRDYLEKAALEGAALPGWLTPMSFIALAILLWMAVPVALAHLAWGWRGRARPAAHPEARAPDRA